MDRNTITIINKNLSEVVTGLPIIKVPGIDIKVILLFNVLENLRSDFHIHSHSLYEFTIIGEGSMDYRFGKRVNNLGKGDICMIPPGIVHSKRANLTPILLISFMLEIQVGQSSFKPFIQILNDDLKRRGYHFKDCYYLYEIAEILRDVNVWNSPFAKEVVTLKTQELLVCFFRDFFGSELENIKERSIYTVCTKNNLLELVDIYIDEHIGKYIKVQDIASYLNISIRHFSRLFKETTGKTFSDYLMTRKIDLVKTYLLEGSLLIKTIAEYTGFTDTAHLCRVFKRKTKMTPAEYIKHKKNYFQTSKISKE